MKKEVRINDKTLDGRVKLNDIQREKIREIKKIGHITNLEISKMFSVSPATIQFILNPNSLEISKLRRLERGGSKIYYKKDEATIAMRKHRAYKKELIAKGLIK